MKEFLNECNTNIINSLYTHNIKKCPFCGGEAVYESTQRKHGIVYSVYCEKCGVEMAKLNSQEVIEAWNRRATKEELKFGGF